MIDSNTGNVEPKYDFTELLEACDAILMSEEFSSKHYISLMYNLKNALNGFFKDSDCKDLIVTSNTDNLFFGIKAYPFIRNSDLGRYIFDEDCERIKDYTVEIDSKLLYYPIQLNSHELLSLLLHEIGSLINNKEYIFKLRDTLAAYCDDNMTVLNINKIDNYKTLVNFGVSEYLSKVNSAFYLSDEQVMADEFLLSYGLQKHLSSALKKLSSSGMLIVNKGVKPFSSMQWVLNIYNDLEDRRLSSIKTLKQSKELTGSVLEKKALDSVIRELSDISVSLREASNVDTNYRNLMSSKDYSNYKNSEDSYYELLIRSKNISTMQDCMYIMRKINTHLSIIEEYLSKKNISSGERDKWDALMKDFLELRSSVAKDSQYAEKRYGLYVQYPDIVHNRYN